MNSRKDIVRAFVEGRAKGQTRPTQTRGCAVWSTDGGTLSMDGTVIAMKTTGGLIYFHEFNRALAPIWSMVGDLSPVPPVVLLPHDNIDEDLIFSSVISPLSNEVATFKARSGSFYAKFSRMMNLAIAIAHYVENNSTDPAHYYIGQRLPAIVTYNAFPEQGSPNRAFWCGDTGDANITRRKYALYLERMGIIERGPQ